MSSSLVRKALELYDEDLSGSSSKKKNFRTANSDVKKRNPKKRSKKNVIEKCREKQNVKYTDKNLDFLRNMNEGKESTKEMLRKIIRKTGMCSSKKLYKNKKSKSKTTPPSTAFSDEDFKKFEKEYFS